MDIPTNPSLNIFKEHILENLKNTKTYLKKSVFAGTGFIPSLKELSIDPNIVINDINFRRFADDKFPSNKERIHLRFNTDDEVTLFEIIVNKMSQEVLLSNQEINDRLHYFNLTQDWSGFTGVPARQEVCFMYPNSIRIIGHTDDQHKDRLLKQFGHLSPEWQEKYNRWLNNNPSLK